MAEEYVIRIYVSTPEPRLLEMTHISDIEQAKAFVWDRLTNPERYQSIPLDTSWRICNITRRSKV